MICDVPNTQTPDITSCLLLQKSANLLDLGATTRSIVEKVAKLATIRLDIYSAFRGPGIAF
jgi:hypothetical protein